MGILQCGDVLQDYSVSQFGLGPLKKDMNAAVKLKAKEMVNAILKPETNSLSAIP